MWATMLSSADIVVRTSMNNGSPASDLCAYVLVPCSGQAVALVEFEGKLMFFDKYQTICGSSLLFEQKQFLLLSGVQVRLSTGSNLPLYYYSFLKLVLDWNPESHWYSLIVHHWIPRRYSQADALKYVGIEREIDMVWFSHLPPFLPTMHLCTIRTMVPKWLPGYILGYRKGLITLR